MNENMKDKFLKEHELSMEDLDEISGGGEANRDCTLKHMCTIGCLFYNSCLIKENGRCPNGYT